MFNLFSYLISELPQEIPPVHAELGTFEMAKSMKDDGTYLFISKCYSVVQWTKFAEENRNLMERIVLCKSENQAAALYFLLDNVTAIRRVYLTSQTAVLSENFKKFVNNVKRKYPDYAVMVGKAETHPKIVVQDDVQVQNVWLWSYKNNYACCKLNAPVQHIVQSSC